MIAPSHLPVLRERVLALLTPAVGGTSGAVVVDATLGLGGHAEALLAEFSEIRLVGLDRDPTALDRARDRLHRFSERVTLVHAVYDAVGDVLAGLGLTHVRGVVFDLGVSSMQLDEIDRGFSYARDAPLDMRMDQTTGITAADVLNTYSAAELARILREYGEERFARKIAQAIVQARQSAPFTTSAALVDLIRSTIPAATRRKGGNPAKRTFQALRIEVNGELAALERALPAAIDALAVRGRIVVLAYHSLEDRLVKRVFAAGASAQVPADLPSVPANRAPYLRLLTRGAERAGDEEIAANPRAKSVRLRAAERIREAA